MNPLKNILVRIALAALLMGGGASAIGAGIDLIGHDTDLFTTNPAIPAQVPNVLFILDNTSDWDRNNNGWNVGLDSQCGTAGIPVGGGQIKQGYAELCAIYLTLKNLTPAVNVGIQMFNPSLTGGGGGSYVRYPMSSMTTSNLSTLSTLVTGMDIGSNTNKISGSSSNSYEDKMNDAFRYFNSLAVSSSSNTSSPADKSAYTDPPSSGNCTSTSCNNFQFISGQNGDTCGYDYIIFIGNGFPAKGPSWTANPPAGGAADLIAAAALLNDSTNVTFGANNANLVPLQATGSNADVWAKFMFNFGVKVGTGTYRHITTYTINICPYSATGDTSGCDASQSTLMQSMATVSQGKYFAESNLAGIQAALATIFAEVQAVNSVFAATTLPVSINVRGTNLNQVYIGVFRPDALGSPRWLGNLKQYQLGVNSSSGGLELQDASNVQAVNLNTGFVSNTAKSFWTSTYNAWNTSPSKGFWGFRSTAGYANTDVGQDQDSPDGDLVEKGGAAERIRITYPLPDSTSAARNILTCTGACGAGTTLCSTFTSGVCTSGYLFNDANTGVTATALGTYQSFTVNPLTASGTTATATTSAAHGFAAGDTVTIAGATPNLFNGNFTVLASGLTSTQFKYTLTSTPDTTHAYVTQAGYTLVPGADLVTVSSATPTDYNVTSAAITAVSGNANQYSYTLASSPTAASSGHSVTGVRRVQLSGGTANVTWSNASSLNNVTVNLSSHNYSSGDTIAISGATDAAFNTGGSIIVKTGTNQFTYTTGSTPAGGTTTTGVVTLTGSLPSGWGNGTVVKISGVTNQTNYNTASSGTAISSVSGNTFNYTTSGTISAAASGTMIANQVVASDTSTWTVASAPTIGTSDQGTSWTITAAPVAVNSPDNTHQRLRVTLAQAALSSSTNSLRKLGNGDPITITGGTCTYKVGGTTSTNCNGLTIAVVSGDSSALATGLTASTTLQNLGGTVTLDLEGTATGGTALPANIGTITFTGPVTVAYAGTLSNKLTFTLTNGKYSGQLLRQLAVGDVVTFANCSYTAGSSGTCSGPVTAVTNNSSTFSGSTPAANTYGGLVTGGSAPTVTMIQSVSSNITATTVTGTAAGGTPAGGATTIAWTGTTTGANVAITSITPGPLTVNAAGTVYASKSGDLTSAVTSITNQSVATGSITAGLATVPDPAERTHLINWVRGQDNKDDENKRDGSSSTAGTTCISTNTCDVRASVHGDVLHSRPAVINYNRNGDNNDVYIFYGSNDGMVHAIKGGQDQSSGNTSGNEQWTFIAPEHFGRLKRLRNQTPTISSANPKDYFFDGPIGVYTLDANNDGKLTSGDASGDKVYLFISMRRGGRMIYALDVTDPTSPKLLWKKGCPNTTGTSGCDTGWSELGQTWSQPQAGYVRAYPSDLVLIFGAGYDAPAEDFQSCTITAYSSSAVQALIPSTAVYPSPMTTANCPPAATGFTATTGSRTMGRGVFVVKAADGSVLWRAGPDAGADKQVTGMTYAIPADLAVLKNRSNTAARSPSTGVESVPTGYVDRIYAPDTGGNVWRIDIGDADKAKWVVTQFASVATASASSTTTGTPAAANMRKFSFQPDVVYTSDANGAYDAVLLGSGDREHPFEQVVQNRFYMFKDRNTSTLYSSAAVGTLTGTVFDAVTSHTTAVAPATIVYPAVLGEGDLSNITSGCLQDVTLCSGANTAAQTAAQTSAAAALLAAKGWMMTLSTTGEKVIAPATTAANSVIFNTNEPKQDTVTGTSANVGANAVSGACVSDLGTARQYGVNFQTGNAGNIFNTLPTQYVPSAGHGRYAMFAGGGFLPQPVPAVVQIGGKYYQTVIAGVQATNPGGLSLQHRVRTYWYKKVD